MNTSVLVRYGRLRYLGEFPTPLDGLRAGDKVVLKTERGTELGEVVCLLEKPSDDRPAGALLRRASTGDKDKVLRLSDQDEREAYKYCLQAVRRFELDMRLTEVEYLLGGEKMIFYFVAPKRVDFRDMVRDLAHRYHTRIEMRQIGARDEARILADYEVCGRELCCRTHLTEIQPVSIKMAKNQSTTMDPAKLAGRCGRLKCCLRYEDPVYTEHRKCIPKHGSTQNTEKGEVKVVGTNILGLEVTLLNKESKTRETVRASALKSNCNGCTRCH